jgi:hypothetical protein
MDAPLKAQLCVLVVFLLMAATAGCLRLISAEQLDDGSSVMCFRVEPTPDAGAEGGVSAAPAMRYVPARAPVGMPAPTASAP